MVAAPLNIDRRQIHAGQWAIRLLEKMMPNVGGDMAVEIIHRISGKAQQNRIDSALVKRGRVEKHLSQLQGGADVLITEQKILL